MKIRSFSYGAAGFLILASFIFSCTTRKPYYDKSQITWKTSSPDSLKLMYSVFLVGDVGNPDAGRQEPTLKLLQQQIFYKDSLAIAGGDTTNTSHKQDAVIFLGDNIYERGLPDVDAPDRKEKERRITEQMNVVKKFKGKTIFVPGNHDWDEMGSGGLLAVNRQEQFIENYMDSADVFLPSNGCGGPVEVRMGNDLVIIVIDTQWWLHKNEKPMAPDNGCSVSTRLDVITQVQDIVRRNKGKNILLAQHHPLFSNGKHGGNFTLKDYFFPLTLVRDNAYVPLPVIGSIYPLMRQYGVSPQDISSKDYQQLKRGLLSALEEEKNVVVAAGHEHALQYNKYNDLNFITSGAGSKSSPLRKGNGALFNHGSKGFARLNYYDNGQCWVEFWEPEGDGSMGKLMYRTPMYAIPPKGSAEIREEKLLNYKDSTRILAAGDQYKAGKFKRELFGEHYRDSWATPIKVNYLDPSTYGGGLSAVQLGGGHQTTSLQLKGKDGNLYQFRLIDKDPARLLPEGFQKTFAEDIFQDQISSAHPYGALIIPDMAKAIGIYYASPQLFYMPNSRLLGPYIQQVGGKMGFIEVRPDEDVSDFKSFGNAANAISTRKLYEKIEGDNDNEVDQKMYLKSRLFDILIGDWDRHEDQWRWAEFKKDKGSIYRPIPRDRDQAFAKYDGIIPRIAAKAIPDLQSFSYEIKNVADLSIAARNLDRSFLNKLSKNDWLATAKEIQDKLTDQIIESAVTKFPSEVRSISGDEIIAKLKSRRAKLVKVASDYYAILSKNVTVTGTDKKEFFKIEQIQDQTRLQIYKIDKDDKIDSKIYDRSFTTDETSELVLFGLKGKDSLIIKGDKLVKIRFVGGEGKDYINTTNSGSRVLVYDSNDENRILKGNGTVAKLSANDDINIYERDAFNYNRSGIKPSVDFNGDDLLFIGLGYGIKKNGFRKDPYATVQDIAANIAPKTGAYTIRYNADFYSLLGRKNDLITKTSWNGPKYTFNYYGEGNSSVNEGDPNLYYRARTTNFSFTSAFQHRFTKVFKVGIGPGYEYYKVEKTGGRFFSSAGFPNQADLNKPAHYGTLRLYADLDLSDDPLSPGSGIRWRNEANYFNEFGNTRNKFIQLKSILSFYLTPNFSFPVTAAIRVGAARNSGDYKFFQSNSLGRNAYLRGFRNNRFSGRSYLFGNTEIRLKLTDIRNYIFTGDLGIFGFFDSGRVFSEQAESSAFHSGYGPGFWINFYNKFKVSTSYGISTEGSNFTVKGGVNF